MINSRVGSKSSRAMSFGKPGIVLGLVSLIALLAISVFAESWENKDWTQWSSQDCYHILYSSPWAAVDGSAAPEYPQTAQVVSSLVIRQAIVRQSQFEKHYDKMKPEEKQQFDQMASAYLSLKFDDRIVVRANGFYTDFNTIPLLMVSGRNIKTILRPQYNAISPCPFTETSPHQMYPDINTDLVFPRVVDGKPVIQPGDTKIEVETPWDSGFKFDLEKMIYKGKPDY